jgi:O-antigen/teichoic acid export membrane protein
MNKSLRAILSLSWQSVAYGIGVLGSQLIIYVTLPFLTRYMPREEYGVVSVITALYTLLNTLTNAGLPAATYRFYNDTQNERERQFILGGSQFLFMSFAVIPAAVILIFPEAASVLLLGSDRYRLVLQVVACFLIVDTFDTYGTVLLRLDVRALVSSGHSIILIACKTGLALLFVIKYDMGVLGYWLGQLAGECIGFLIMAWLVRKKISFKISWHQIWDLLKFGLPLLPATFSTTFLKLADRYIVGSLAGLDQVAIYDVGYKIGSIILILITPFRAAWTPFAFSIAQKPEAPRVYRDVLTYLTAGCSFLILGVYAFRSEIVGIMAPASYREAANVVGFVALAQLFYTAYLVLSIGPMIKKQTHQLAWIAVIAGITSLLLNFILIPIIGILGAAVALLVGYALLAFLAYFTSRRSIDMTIDWERMRQLAVAIGLVLLVILMAEQLELRTWVEIAVKVIGLLAFPVLLFLTKFVNSTQTKELMDMTRNIVGKKFTTKSVDEFNDSV